MSTLTIILLLVVAIIVVVLVLASFKPAVGRYERSAVVHGPREKVFAKVNTLPSWREWSPWEEKDPNMNRTYSGPESGVGATYGWKGNNKVGEGTMTIAESVPHERVQLDLVFIKPFAGTMTSTFAFSDETDGTRVVWSAASPHNLMGRIMCVFVNMDKMIGADFERGLARLDSAMRN